MPIAVGLSLAALPMVIVAVVLVTKRPLGASYAFLGGWVLGLLLVGAIVLAVADGVTLTSEPAPWASTLKFLLGVVLGVLAVRKWSGRPQSGDEPQLPKWMAAADKITAGKAFGLGFLLAAANPKQIVIVVAGAAVIADATPHAHEQVAALIIFVAVASLGVAAPAVVRQALGARSDRILELVDQWMTNNNAVIMSAVLLILGLILIGNGIAGL